jgi:hypothetical protein
MTSTRKNTKQAALIVSAAQAPLISRISEA